MASQSTKFSKSLSPQDAAAFLRELADKIEKGLLDQIQEFDVDFDDFKKMKLGIKRVDDRIVLKAKVKYTSPHVVEKPPAAGREKTEKTQDYSTLKKRMQKTFKGLGPSMQAGMLPDMSLVNTFAVDSELMVSYPGFGDAFYEAYSKAVKDFQAACEHGNAQEAAELYQALKARRKECHGRYK